MLEHLHDKAQKLVDQRFHGATDQKCMMGRLNITVREQVDKAGDRGHLEDHLLQAEQ